MVVFVQIGSILAKGGCVWPKEVVLGQIGSVWTNWFYLSKNGSTWAKGGCIWANVWLYLAKLVLSWKRWFYLGKLIVFGQTGSI